MHRSPGQELLPDPIAFFITWSTYGTWLPGDARGWTEYRRGWQMPNLQLELEAQAKMSEDACLLNPVQRRIAEQTIVDHCQIRKWVLHAVNCRTNHLHVVVSAAVHPKLVRGQFKAWCTRKLKDAAVAANGSRSMKVRENWWAERGSIRYIYDEDRLGHAVFYVRDAQDRKWRDYQGL